MSPKHRLRQTVDLTQERLDEVNRFRPTREWEELSFPKKINLMIGILLEAKRLGLLAELEQKLDALRSGVGVDESTISGLVAFYWESVVQAIVEGQIDLSVKRLQALRDGDRPTNQELIELSMVLPQDTHQLVAIRDATFGKNGDRKNGDKRDGVTTV